MDGVPFIGARVPRFYMCPIGGETFCAGEELFCNYTVGNENYVSLDKQDYRFLGSGNSKYVRPLAFQEKQLENERKKASKEEAQLNLEGVSEQTINDANDLGIEFETPDTTSAASGSTPVALPKKKVPDKKRKRSQEKKKRKEEEKKESEKKKRKKESGKKTASGRQSSRLDSAEPSTDLAQMTLPLTVEHEKSSK